MTEMSETTVQMAKKTFLEVCREIEAICAEMYHYYSKIFAHIPEAAALWEKTALEEENHRKQFELAILLWNDTEFEVAHEHMKLAYTIQAKLNTLMENIRKTAPDLLTAVSKAVEMEEILADLHAHTSLKFKEESMQKLFVALNNADRNHIADLQHYRSILYLPLSEMTGSEA